MAKKRALAWWRLKVDRSGKVLECKRVTRALKNGVRTFYVAARSQEEAGRKAFNAYCRVRLAARRERYRAEGKCKCGRRWDRSDGFRQCPACRQQVQAYRDREAARKAGAVVPPINKAETLRLRREREDADLRLSVLQEVREAWAGAETIDEFVRWLCDAIVEAGGGPQRGRAA